MSLSSSPSHDGFAAGGLSPARIVQLLAAVEARYAILLTRTPGGTEIAPLPDDSTWAHVKLTPDDIERSLDDIWLRASRDRQFAVELPPRTKAFTLPGLRPTSRRVLVMRLDDGRQPGQLLLLPLPAPALGRTQPAFNPLRVKATLDAALTTTPQPAPAVQLRSWESLAEVLPQGLFLCDRSLKILHINKSAEVGLDLQSLALLGRSFLALPWDAQSRATLTLLHDAPAPFQQAATLERSGRTIPVLLTGRLLHDGGLLIAASIQEPAPQALAAGSLIPFRASDPPPVAMELPMPHWCHSLAVQPMQFDAAAAVIQEWIPIGAGVGAWLHLGVHEDAEVWRPWLTAVAHRLKSQLTPLTPMLELLQETVATCLMPRGDIFPGWIALGRVSGEHRSMEWAAIGAVGLAHWSHQQHRWDRLAPDRSIYLAHGCPELLQWTRTLLPGEGLLAIPLGPGRQALADARNTLSRLTEPFPQIGWPTLREHLPDAGGLGGCLLRFSQGVQEQTSLYPGDFQVFIDLLCQRLKARGAQETCYKVKLALDEILTNAFRHGHQGDLSRPVAVELLFEPGCLRVTILDQGAGYDLLGLKDPRALENLEADGGRGILLTHEVMDGLEFGLRTNHITLTKYLPTASQTIPAAMPPISR